MSSPIKITIDVFHPYIARLYSWASVSRTLNQAYSLLEDTENADKDDIQTNLEELHDITPALDHLHRQARQALWDKFKTDNLKLPSASLIDHAAVEDTIVSVQRTLLADIWEEFARGLRVLETCINSNMIDEDQKRAIYYPRIAQYRQFMHELNMAINPDVEYEPGKFPNLPGELENKPVDEIKKDLTSPNTHANIGQEQAVPQPQPKPSNPILARLAKQNVTTNQTKPK